MNSNQTPPVLTIDVGNTSIKMGAFLSPRDDASQLPTLPQAVASGDESEVQLKQWLQALGQTSADCYVASVNHRAEALLRRQLARLRPAWKWTTIDHRRLPLQVDVEAPQRVGIDRLLSAVTANRLRTPDRPAIVVDAGTAITVDVVSAGGAFVGGAILPGMAMAARDLDRYTERLPLVPTGDLSAPSPIGRATETAIRSGVFWGTVGSIRELIHRIGDQLAAAPQVFLTGGDADRLAPHLESGIRIVPFMVLTGIMLTAVQLRQSALASEA